MDITKGYLVLDVETTGLNPFDDGIHRSRNRARAAVNVQSLQRAGFYLYARVRVERRR